MAQIIKERESQKIVNTKKPSYHHGNVKINKRKHKQDFVENIHYKVPPPKKKKKKKKNVHVFKNVVVSSILSMKLSHIHYLWVPLIVICKERCHSEYMQLQPLLFRITFLSCSRFSAFPYYYLL